VYKLPSISGKKVISVLKKAGFVQIRQKGSHLSLQKITPDKTYKVVVPMHKELAKGTLLDILRQSGFTKEDLIRLL